MKEHYNKVLRTATPVSYPAFTEIQILDRNDPFFGGRRTVRSRRWPSII